jgi:hypothetical protein
MARRGARVETCSTDRPTPDHHVWVTSQYERYAADAAVLGQIGRAIFPQPTRVKVRLPRALADLAVAAWARDEADEDHASASEETPEQATARRRAGTLALIGLSIEQAGGGPPAGEDVLVGLDAWNVGSALDAADDGGLLAGLRSPGPDEGLPTARVFLLWHISHDARADASSPQHLDDDGSPLCDEQAGDDVKLLGVYSIEIEAQARIASARMLPGFSDEPDCFQVTPYTLDKDQWTEGFPAAE